MSPRWLAGVCCVLASCSVVQTNALTPSPLHGNTPGYLHREENVDYDETMKREEREESTTPSPRNGLSMFLGSTVTISPTPLLSSFSKFQEAYDTGEDAQLKENGSASDEVYLPNIAVNSSCILSSSPENTGTFCKLTEESYRIATASEEDPFILIDLEKLAFVDHVSFGVNVDSDSVQHKLSVMCLNATQPGMTNSDPSRVNPVWSKLVMQNSASYSFHVHSPCQILRFQRLSFGQLAISNLKIYGAEIKNSEVLGCLSGHTGTICSRNGECRNGECQCKYGYFGTHCEDGLWAILMAYGVQGASLLTVLVGVSAWLWCNSAWRQSVTLGYKLASQDDINESERPSQPVTGRSKSVALEGSPSESGLSVARSRSLPQTLTQGTGNGNVGALHMLFASPLVACVNGNDGPESKVRPIQSLNIHREYALLAESLKRAAGSYADPIPVTVSTATVDQFHSLMTVGNARCLHFSGHSTKEFLAFEDVSGKLHRITLPMLRRLLRSTISPKSLQTLRMVVLNACYSEEAALEFIMAGFSHVVAYRGKVRDSTAAIFTQSLYLALACGRTVHDAFESAREAVYSSPTFDEKEKDSFMLLPERGNHNEKIWKPSATETYECVARWPLMKGMRPLPHLADEFLGRHYDMWQIMEGLKVHKRRLTVLHGVEGVGRTQLATAVAHHAHLRRSPCFFPDGVFFVRAEAMNEVGSELAFTAALVDQIYKAFQNHLDQEPYCQASERFLDYCNERETLLDVSERSSSEVEIRQLKRKISSWVELLSAALSKRESRCLLVIDDITESSLVTTRVLQPLLDLVPQLRMVVTCSTPYYMNIDVNIQHFAVAPLAPSDATLLFLKHLKRSVLINGKPPSLAELGAHRVVTEASGIPAKIVRCARSLGSEGSHPLVLE